MKSLLHIFWNKVRRPRQTMGSSCCLQDMCRTCETMDKWNQMGFGIPMLWREPTNHVNDCYFFSINVTGVNKKKRKSLSYKSFPSAIRPVAHSTDISIPEFNKLPDLFIDEHSDEEQHDYKELTDVVDDDKDCMLFHATTI